MNDEDDVGRHDMGITVDELLLWFLEGQVLSILLLGLF